VRQRTARSLGERMLIALAYLIDQILNLTKLLKP